MNGGWAALLALALITTGCLVPAVGHKVISGTEIRPEQLAFIEDGVTTRGEITERFGEPWAWYPDLHVCVYFWETASGYWRKHYCAAQQLYTEKRIGRILDRKPTFLFLLQSRRFAPKRVLPETG